VAEATPPRDGPVVTGRTTSGRAGRGPVDPRLVREAPALRAGLAGFAAGSTLATVCTIAQAVLLARVVAAVFIAHRGFAQVRGDLVWMAVAMSAKAVTAGAMEWVGQHTSARVRSELRRRLLSAVSSLGPHWFARTPPGRVVTAAVPGIESLDGYITRAVPAAVAAMITPPLVLAAIGFTDWPSLVLLALTLPLVPVFLALIGVSTKRHMQRQWATLSKLSGQFLDLVEGLTTLKVYGRSRAQVQAVRDGTDRYRRHTLGTLRVAFVSGLVLDLIATLSVALVAVAVGLRLDHGHLGLQRALTVLLLAPEVFAPLRAVGAQYHATEEARAVVGEATEIIAEAGGLPADPAVGPWVLEPAADGTVAQLRNVGFCYPGRDLPALHGVTADFGAAQMVTLVGPSGAGKSTLLGVLLGQVSPIEGELTVGSDARPLRSAPALAAWRANLAWVPQRPRLSEETVGDEVRLGDPTLSEEQLAGVLGVCAAPAGPTLVGEDGAGLSAGQRRRVSLARAVARARRVAAAGGVPLVLLDEPTEDLDEATEAIVAQVLFDLSAWAAVVVATHDPILRQRADREIRLVDGHITSDSTRPAKRPVPISRTAVPDYSGAAPEPPAATAHPGAAPEPPAAPAGRPNRQSGRHGLRFRVALARARGARRSLLLACLFGALGGISGLALTATSVWLICRAAEHPNVQALAIAVVGVRTFALARALLRYVERLAAHDGALRLLAEVRAQVFEALEPLAPFALGGFRRGDLLRRFTSDVDGAQEALTRAAVPLAGAAITAVAATGLVALIAPAAAWVLAAGLVVAGVVIPTLTVWAAAQGSPVAAGAARRDGLTTGLLDGLSELSAYGGVADRLDRIAAADRATERAGSPARRAGAAGVAASGITAAVTVTMMVAAGARAVVAGTTAGILLGVVAAAGLVAFDALGALPGAYAALGRCWAGLRRVEEILATQIPIPVPDRAVAAPTPVKRIGARGVTLRPAPDAAPVLVDAGLQLADGQRVAIVGRSGCGKSTLLAALLRLVPTEHRPVTLGSAGRPDVALQDLHPDQLPPLVAGSLQGDHVFATTLRDNLRVVAGAATDADLDALAERVGLAEWVRSLPAGWSTQAGADGCRLSGGQRQRLLLARALLADPQILVLDEPTAHLDPATQALVMADLIRCTAGRTLIMSTHRAGLLTRFDRVLFLEGERLSEGVPALPVGAGGEVLAVVGPPGVASRPPEQLVG